MAIVTKLANLVNKPLRNALSFYSEMEYVCGVAKEIGDEL
jgi:hypothetical protein